MKKDRSRKSALTTVIFVSQIIPGGRGSATNTTLRDLLSYTEQLTQNIGDFKIIRYLNHLIITEVNQFRGVKIHIM